MPWSGRCSSLRHAAQEGGGHGGRAGFLSLPLFPGRRIQRLGRGRHRVRARRPWRHHGAAGEVLHRRRHSAARPRQDGLDLTGPDRRNRRPHPQRRRRDRQPAQDRIGVLRAGRFRDRDGRELSARQEARAALRGLSQRRVRRERHVCRRPDRHRLERCRAHCRNRTGRQGSRSLRQVGRRGAGPGRCLQEDRAGPARPLLCSKDRFPWHATRLH